jgi:hypothetical protein
LSGAGAGSPDLRGHLQPFEGTCNPALIESWFAQQRSRSNVRAATFAQQRSRSNVRAATFAQQLLPVLVPGQVVILDNASFHRHQKLRELLETKGCSLLPLPPYSPDFNAIEHLWPQIKTRIALDTNFYPSFRLKVDAAFL